MPIIKSSSNGDDITVVVFTKEEADAFVNIMWNASFKKSKDVKASIEMLEEMFYAFGIPYPPE
jgi:hypothetical protein